MGDPDAPRPRRGLCRAPSFFFSDAVRPPVSRREGYACAWGAPTRWYVAHASLADLPTASLDRVIGRNPDLWMPEPAARAAAQAPAERAADAALHPSAERGARGARQRPAQQHLDQRQRPAPAAARGRARDGGRAAARPRVARGLALLVGGLALARRRPPARGARAPARRRAGCGSRCAASACGQSFVAGPRGLLSSLRARFAAPRAAALLQDL
jgi:hypothetical protein